MKICHIKYTHNKTALEVVESRLY